jgi:uncharacterized protein (TIGR00255 family)
MAYSMTAYVSHEITDDGVTICWDVRSVNHRYLDIFYKLPEELRDLEPYLRGTTKKKINRGKLDLTLKVNMLDRADKTFTIDMLQAKQIINACQELAKYMQTPASVSPLDILLLPSLKVENQAYLEKIKKLAADALSEALDKLNLSKQQEGKELCQIISQRLHEIATKIQEIRVLLPNIIPAYKSKLLQKLQDLQTIYNEDRLEQELLYLAQKVDIAEELDRLDIHINETKRTMNVESMLGKRLDFLMQEINREVNTLAAKSTDPKISLITVDLKVLVEQIREQAQNLE